MKKFKRLSAMVSVLLCLSMMFGMCTVFAEDTVPPNFDVEVQQLNIDGEVVGSDIPLSFFLEMPDVKDEITPFYVPNEIETASRTSDTVRKKVEYKGLATALDYTVGLIFASAFARIGSKMVSSETLTKVPESVFKGYTKSFVATGLYNILIDYVREAVCYTESYQYRSWSPYHNRYLVYEVLINYSDPGYTNVIGCTYWELPYNSVQSIALAD